MTKYAFNTNAEEQLQYIGRVVDETVETVTINVYRAMALIWFGVAEESDELKTVPRSQCRFFASEDAMLDSARIAYRDTFQRPTSPNVTLVTID